MPTVRTFALGVLAAAGLGAEAVRIPVWSEASARDLEVTLDGRPIGVEAIQSADDHLILLVVLDMVRYQDRYDAVREVLVQKLRKLGPKYFAGVLTAQDGLAVQLDPIRSRKKLSEKLESLDVRGVPGLLDVVEQASEIADRTLVAAPVRLAVLFVTDGRIEDYRGDYTVPVVNPSDSGDLSRRFGNQLIQARIRHAVDTLGSAQAPLFFLHVARRYDDQNEVYQNGISEFARITGGTALFAQAVQQIPALLESLLDEIAGHAVLTIDAPCTGRLRIEVRGPQGAARSKESIACLAGDS